MIDENPTDKTTEDANQGKKSRCDCHKKAFWMSVSVLALILVPFAIIGVIMSSSCSKKNDIDKVVAEALKMKVYSPESLRVLQILKEDSVFYNRFCPEDEMNNLYLKILDYSVKIMPESFENLQKSMKDESYRRKMERIQDEFQNVQNLNRMMDYPKGNFCGWRVKVRYTDSKHGDSDTEVYESWLIFDKDKKHILKTFDIPVL